MKIDGKKAAIAIALLCVIATGAFLQSTNALLGPKISVRVLSSYTASNALTALQVSGTYFPANVYVSLYFDVVDDMHRLGTVKASSTGTFAFSFDVMEGYTGTHTVIAKYNGAEYTASFNILNTRPMDERLVNLLNWIYGNITLQIDNYFNLTSGTFYTFVDDWFNQVYDLLVVINNTLNQVNTTVNYINGTVNTINGTVNLINGTVNYINGTVTLINGTVNTINGTVNLINTTVNHINNTVNTMNLTLTNINNTVNTINGTVNMINGTVNYINGTVTLINGTVNTINGTVNFINTTVVQINTTVTDIQNTTNFVWTWVQQIENKLDTNGINLAGDFNRSIINWFTWIYGNLTEVNATVNQINTTVNYINGNVTQIGTTVNNINNTANHITDNLTQMNGTVVLMNGTIAYIMGNVTFINNTVNVINGTVNTINTTVNQISGNVSQILTIVNYINGNVTAINVTVKDIQNTTNYIWNEVQNIEAKLDFGGLFYTFVDNWFSYILGNMTQLQNTIGTYLQGNTTLIRNDIANANETILNAIADIGGASGSSGINITTMQYTLNCTSSGYQYVYQRADQMSFNVKISVANADSINNTKINGPPERFEIRYYVGNFSSHPVVQSIYIDNPADSGYYEFVCNWIEFDWTVSDGFVVGYSIVIEQAPT